jgi:hypothetical protein
MYQRLLTLDVIVLGILLWSSLCVVVIAISR